MQHETEECPHCKGTGRAPGIMTGHKLSPGMKLELDHAVACGLEVVDKVVSNLDRLDGTE